MGYITKGEKSREDFRGVAGSFAPPGFGLGVEERVFLEELRGGGRVKDVRVVRGGGLGYDGKNRNREY